MFVSFFYFFFNFPLPRILLVSIINSSFYAFFSDFFPHKFRSFVQFSIFFFFFFYSFMRLSVINAKYFYQTFLRWHLNPGTAELNIPSWPPHTTDHSSVLFNQLKLFFRNSFATISQFKHSRTKYTYHLSHHTQVPLLHPLICTLLH